MVGVEELEGRLARDDAGLGAELVEEQGHEADLFGLDPSGDGRRARSGRCHLLTGLDEPEARHLLLHSVFEDLDLFLSQVAHQPALLVAHHDVEHDDAGVHPERGRGGRLVRGLLLGSGPAEGECATDGGQDPTTIHVRQRTSVNFSARIPRNGMLPGRGSMRRGGRI